VVTELQARASSRERYRELAHRANGHIEVSLLWRKADGTLRLHLIEVATGVVFEVPIQPEHALDAFNHPYAYLPTLALEVEQLLAA
jgi:hypothetical protein